jgi:hypothetical protein
MCVSAMDLLTKLYLLCVLYRFNIGEDGSPFYSQVLIKALQVNFFQSASFLMNISLYERGLPRT